MDLGCCQATHRGNSSSSYQSFQSCVGCSDHLVSHWRLGVLPCSPHEELPLFSGEWAQQSAHQDCKACLLHSEQQTDPRETLHFGVKYSGLFFFFFNPRTLTWTWALAGWFGLQIKCVFIVHTGPWLLMKDTCTSKQGANLYNLFLGSSTARMHTCPSSNLFRFNLNSSYPGCRVHTLGAHLSRGQGGGSVFLPVAERLVKGWGIHTFRSVYNQQILILRTTLEVPVSWVSLSRTWL